MTVREYIESNKEKLIGYKLRIEDYDGYELFAIRMKKETNLDNIRDPLEQQLIDDELVGVLGDADDYEPQMILTSRCELWKNKLLWLPRFKSNKDWYFRKKEIDIKDWKFFDF